MNTKILGIIIVLIVAMGAFIFLGNNKKNPTTSTKDSSSPAVSQPNNPIVNIVLTDSGFAPKEITIKTGTRVIWINKSGKSATVSSDDHPTHRLYPIINLGEFADGSSVQIVFDKAGKYTYHDHHNASSTGTVTVE